MSDRVRHFIHSQCRKTNCNLRCSLAIVQTNGQNMESYVGAQPHFRKSHVLAERLADPVILNFRQQAY